MKNTPNKLIHVARIQPQGKMATLLFLRKHEEHYIWFENTNHKFIEIETSVKANSIEEALRLAHRYWKNVAFRTINCGFRYTLPERDEHGQNALFCQMIASYSSMNGQYFDEEVGHMCIVHYASQEARELANRI